MLKLSNIKKGIQKVRAGFTLIELAVSVTIFVMITALLVARYGTFNQSVLLTNLAYDVALTVRQAQTYGISVQGNGDGSSQPVFNTAYGVAFCASSCPNGLTKQQIALFSDTNGNGRYDGPTVDTLVTTYNLKRGAIIASICTVQNQCDTDTRQQLDVTFFRPYPDALMCRDNYACVSNGVISGTLALRNSTAYAQIFIKSTDGNYREVTIRKTGQVAVEDIVSPTQAQSSSPPPDGAN